MIGKDAPQNLGSPLLNLRWPIPNTPLVFPNQISYSNPPSSPLSLGFCRRLASQKASERSSEVMKEPEDWKRPCIIRIGKGLERCVAEDGRAGGTTRWSLRRRRESAREKGQETLNESALVHTAVTSTTRGLKGVSDVCRRIVGWGKGERERTSKRTHPHSPPPSPPTQIQSEAHSTPDHSQSPP